MTSQEIPENFRALCSFLCALSVSDLPVPQIGKVKDHIVDTLACGVGGMCSAESQRVLAMLLESGETGSFPVWGSPTMLSARSAAFCVGVAVHSFEFDDTDGCDHSGAVVIPAAVSALGLTGKPVSGAEFITAIISGYEIAKRVQNALGGYWPHNSAGWHSTATCGTFGAAVAAARILGLSERQMEFAIGHAASYSGGLWSFIHDASQTKRIHAGKAAEGGLTAALLARSGITGPTHIFENSWGSFLGTFAPDRHNVACLTNELGQVWEFDKAAIKPYPSCRSTHAALDALAQIMQKNSLTSADIVQIEVAGPQGLQNMCGTRDVSSMASAQMSLPYALAALTELGELPLSAYSGDMRISVAVAGRMGSIFLKVDDDLAASAEPIITVTLRSGARLSHHVDPPSGAPANPLSEAGLRKKALDLMTLAIPEAQAVAVLDGIASIDKSADVCKLPRMLQSDRLPGVFH